MGGWPASLTWPATIPEGAAGPAGDQVAPDRGAGQCSLTSSSCQVGSNP